MCSPRTHYSPTAQNTNERGCAGWKALCISDVTVLIEPLDAISSTFSVLLGIILKGEINLDY